MIDLDSYFLSGDEIDLLSNRIIGGVILFSRNVKSRSQLTTLCQEIKYINPELLIAIDQEGGRVQRLERGYTNLPSMNQLAGYCSEDNFANISFAQDIGWLMASEVIASGLDISFAPVLDLDLQRSSIIGDRSFGDLPDKVIEIASLFIDGMNEAGMAATGKHFPGHGGIFADSHLEAPVDRRSWTQLSEHDLVPFVALASKLGGMMPAHITFPQIDPDSVGFSRFWLEDILRGKLGFTGVIFSDDLAMKGADVAGGYVQKAELALDAGCDMILVCNDRAGALEVLDYMNEREIEGSARIGAMMKTVSRSWAQLENDPRRVATMAQLHGLAANN